MADDPSQQAHRPSQHISSRTAHPRRPPAHESVCLMRSPTRPATAGSGRRPKHGHGAAASMQTHASSSLASKPRYQKNSSGESSNAEKWFETSNNNVRDTSGSLIDNDPPFLLRNPSSSETTSDGLSGDRVRVTYAQNPVIQYRTNLAHLHTGASSSEDYRSVIDDLTVENKKLKRRLKKYERFDRPDLQSDKVVEVRTFNIPANKKRELEDVIKKFTMSLEQGQADTSPGTGTGTDRVGAPMEAQKTNSSHTSTRFGDSAYASMSASGNNSNAPSGQSGTNRKGSKSGATSGFTHQQHQNIRSYLQDIPVGLLPKSGPIAMTERSKRKMVVRRLEQIFAGRASTAGGHQQPIQQQEVAQSAAQADRKAIEDSGRRALEEGAREAPIMPEIDGNKDDGSPKDERLQVDVKSIVQQDFANDPFEQRPTRPLDLDPFRAQVPAENIKYIRHLGFSPMDVESTEPQADGHGWIYLNVLINMAQLHTLNVTADFIRKSIADFSSKLELSHDGRKVRWKGGIDVTRTSSDSSPEDEHGLGKTSKPEPEPRKRSKLATAISSNDGSSENVSKSNNTSSNRLAYTPLFFHKLDVDDANSDENMSSWSSPPVPAAGESSEFVGSGGMRMESSRRKRGDDGPIIFYNKASFCTDLSGDPRGKDLALTNKVTYNRLNVAPVGETDESSDSSGKEMEGRGLLSQPLTADVDGMQLDAKSLGEIEMDSDQPKRPSAEASSSEDSPVPIEFEASGVGGVMPVDNFAIRIKSKRQIDTSRSYTPKPSKMYPPHIREILAKNRRKSTASQHRSKPIVREQVISEHRKDLAPSELPPPSFFPFGSPDSDAEEGSSETEIEDDMSFGAAVLEASPRPLPAAAPQMIDWPTYASGEESSSEEEDDDEEMEDESDSSLDLLAAARQADPMAVLAKEREYDSQMADRLAEEIPAGSSAATAGGGSGFNSPVSPKDDAGGIQPRNPILKRTRPNDSAVLAAGRPLKSPRPNK